MSDVRDGPSVGNVNERHRQDNDVENDDTEHVGQPQPSGVHPGRVRIGFTVSTGNHFYVLFSFVDT